MAMHNASVAEARSPRREGSWLWVYAGVGKHYRVIVNSLLLTWLGIGFWTMVSHRREFALLYSGLVIVNLFLVALHDCRSCPRRLGSCTHFYVGRLTKLLPPKPEGQSGMAGHAAVAVIWGCLHLMPQYWLWQHKPVLVLFWFLPIAALIFLRRVVCWQMCGNKDCPLNKMTHPLPWEARQSLQSDPRLRLLN